MSCHNYLVISCFLLKGRVKFPNSIMALWISAVGERVYPQVAQIVVSSLLVNCVNHWEMVGWHASNEPMKAQQF